jgi:hypothetical protein
MIDIGKDLQDAFNDGYEQGKQCGWIPVSERLPNNCGLGVLLTIENKFQQRKVIQGFTGYMERGRLEFHTNDKCTNLEVWRVIAWQPLPEPYEEEDYGLQKDA